MKNSFFIFLGLIFLSLGFLVFDFSPRIHKEILQAQGFIANQEYKKAILRYEHILERNPNKKIEVKILYQLGDLYSIYLSQNEKAIKYYQRIVNLSEDPLWLVRTEERIAEIHFSYLKNYEKALKIYDKLNRFTPKLRNQDFYQFRYSQCLLRLNYLKWAEENFKKIRKNERHEYYIRSAYFLGLINFQKKKWQKSIDYWKDYIRKETRSDNVVQVKFLMANAYETMEKLKHAYNLYYSILGEYPNTEVIQNRLNSIYNRRVARKR